MARTPTKTGAPRKRGTTRKATRGKPAAAPRRTVQRAAASANESSAADAFFKLLESPLVADLLAVGATAALAAITEHRLSRKTGGSGSSKLLKAAGGAAAAAIGRRLASEFKEIKQASKKVTGA